jgi:hypothetical protein
MVGTALGGCGDGDPTALPGPPDIAAVRVTSPIDTVMAAGGSVQLEAVGLDAAGAPIGGLSFTWTSSDNDIASVNSAGVLAGVPGVGGTLTVTATTGGGASGTLPMRVVHADLPAVAALIADPWTDALAGALSATPGGVVATALDGCADALEAGHVLNLRVCLRTIQTTTAAGGTDRALLAVLGVAALRAELYLALETTQ